MSKPGTSKVKVKRAAPSVKGPRLTAVAPPKASASIKPRTPDAAHSASLLIDERIRDLSQNGDWRGKTLARMRSLILAAPGITEEVKWMGTPVWSHQGILCTGEAYKIVVKLTFAQGAGFPDSSRLIDSSLEGNTRRAIDIREGETVNAAAFKALIKAAIAHNAAKAAAKTEPRSNKPPKRPAGSVNEPS